MTQASDDDDQPMERLMRLAQQGDADAYTRLFQRITPVLRGYVTRRLGARADVEDVVQTILLSLHRASHTYDTLRPFEIWMFAISRHCLNDHLRQIYKKRTFPHIAFDDLGHDIAVADGTDQRDRRAWLHSLMNALPDRQRKIVTMMKIEGHSAEDTAKAVNMSVTAVKVAAHRAVRTMARRAEKLQDIPLQQDGQGHGHG